MRVIPEYQYVQGKKDFGANVILDSNSASQLEIKHAYHIRYTLNIHQSQILEIQILQFFSNWPAFQVCKTDVHHIWEFLHLTFETLTEL